MGWDEDQCWTLARIAEVVRRRFKVTYTLAGLDLLLHRIGWSVQVPARQAAERDEARITAWREETWPVVKGRRRTWAPWQCFEDESGQGLRPPKGRTWGWCGATPVVKVTGGQNKRVSRAALICMKPGQRPRLIYRVHRARPGRKDELKGFSRGSRPALPTSSRFPGPAFRRRSAATGPACGTAGPACGCGGPAHRTGTG
jgi:hypothetical protein